MTWFFQTPANDISLAIVALFIESFWYGMIILFTVISLLAASILLFTLDEPSVLEEEEENVLSGASSVVRALADRHGITLLPYKYRSEFRLRPGGPFPFYFSKRAESVLDITFLLFPTVLVCLMLIPTLGFLYNKAFFFEQIEPAFNLTVIGHQWYWSYEYDLNILDFSISFDSIMDPDAVENLYLAVDNNVVIPVDVKIGLAVTSTDVIHSWAVPQLGIKMDAMPGRYAYGVLYSFSTGVFYGQCSELCGALHGFMPICVEVVPTSVFFNWVLLHMTEETDLFDLVEASMQPNIAVRPYNTLRIRNWCK